MHGLCRAPTMSTKAPTAGGFNVDTPNITNALLVVWVVHRAWFCWYGEMWSTHKFLDIAPDLCNAGREEAEQSACRGTLVWSLH